jgi:DNA-binding NtrC family response regulator
MNEVVNNTNQYRRVLIVEDEVNQRQMLARVIREAEFDSVAVASAEEALTLLEEDARFGVAMLDLNLPGMDGLSLATRMFSRWPDIRCIILTGYATLDAARQAFKLDVIDFLIKPSSLGEIEAALSRAWVKHADRAPTPRRLPQPAPEPPEPIDPDAPISIADAERQMIEAALRRHQDNRSAAAKELGISVRTLYYRLAQYEAGDRLQESRTINRRPQDNP